MEIKKGTLACRLFGHKFLEEKLEYHPYHSEIDYQLVGYQTDYCVRCGLQDKQKEIER